MIATGNNTLHSSLPSSGGRHSGGGQWLGFELSILRRLKFSSIAIPFSGQPDLEWYLKFWGKQILNNDICQWAWWISRAYIENKEVIPTPEYSSVVLSEADTVKRRLNNPALLYYLNEEDASWFDNAWLNIQLIGEEIPRAAAYATVLRLLKYPLSFNIETKHLKRSLSEVFVNLWQKQPYIVDNSHTNYCLNRDAHEFIRSARADLMFVRFPGPQGLIGARRSLNCLRETWVRGSDEYLGKLKTDLQGRLGDISLSKEKYLRMIGTFLARAEHIPQWAIAHTDSGFVSASEIAEVIKKFRRIDVIYNKDFSDVVEGRNTFIIIA